MGLISEAQADLKEAFDDDLSDVVKQFTLNHSENGDYDPTTGTYTKTSMNYRSRGVFEDFGTAEINANAEIKNGDVKLIVLTNEIGIEPAIDDAIDNYTVMNTKNVFDIAYEVQLRGI